MVVFQGLSQNERPLLPLSSPPQPWCGSAEEEEGLGHEGRQLPVKENLHQVSPAGQEDLTEHR